MPDKRIDWAGVGKKIVELGAPILGTAVGGPAGGVVGKLVASLFGGDEEPEKVLDAITADPEAALKLKELESRQRVRLEEITLEHARIEAAERSGVLTEVNATMRAEAASEHWPQWSWRPFWGFISGFAFLGVVIQVGVMACNAVASGDVAALATIPALVSNYTMLFAIPGGVLGITAWGRNRLKEKRAGGQASNDHLSGAEQ